MNSGVGASGRVGRDRRALQLFQRHFDHALNRRLIELSLPAEIIRAVVSE